MPLIISNEDYQDIEMLLNLIVDQAKLLADNKTTYSIIHNSNTIRKILNKPKYKCYSCKDSGEIEEGKYMGHTRGMEYETIPCPSCNRKK